MSVLQSAIQGLIFEPARYWPDESYFHRRNRQKLARSWSKMRELHQRTPREVAERFGEILEARSNTSPTTAYVMSNGSSGCHFLGALLDGLPGFVLTDEVYFPPHLLAEAAESPNSSDRLVLDFINYFHTGIADTSGVDQTIVNIGHLRRDAPPTLLQSLDPNGRLILLIRNPYDVAISRAFRKGDYRMQVAPEMSDSDYLRRQVSGTYSFLSYASNFAWDRIVRYEDLRKDPTAVVGDLVREQGSPFDIDAFEAVRALHDAERIADRAQRSERAGGNLNVEPPPELTHEQISILDDGLGEIARQLGYRPPTTMEQPTQ